MSLLSEEERSTDGSDSEGSLKDFLASEEDESSGDDLSDTEEENDDTALLKEFPYDKALLEEASSTGPRRSRRVRKQTTHYVDERYVKLMLADVESDLDEDQEDDQEEDQETQSFSSLYSEDDDSENDSENDDEKSVAENGETVQTVKKTVEVVPTIVVPGTILKRPLVTTTREGGAVKRVKFKTQKI